MIDRLINNLHTLKKCYEENKNSEIKELMTLIKKDLVNVKIKDDILHQGYVRELEFLGYYIDEYHSSKHRFELSCNYFSIPF